METASLVIRVDSSGAKRATHDLDELAKQGAKTERSALALGKSFGLALGALGVVGVGLLGKYVKNTAEAERVQAQLNATLKSTHNAAGLAIGDLNTMAGALQNVTRYDDEAIGSAQALLLTFTKIGRETFPEALEAVLDMSTALGQDLRSSAIQVGKALNDPIQGVTALGRAGVQFSDDQKALIKSLVETGKTAEAQRIVLKELETQMGGSAKAARDTLGGAVDGLKNAFDNLLEGDASGGGVVATKNALNDLTDTLNDPDVKRGVDSIVGGIGEIVGATLEGVGAIARLQQNISTLFSLSDKVSSGAALSTYSDRELQVRLANLSEQKSKARKGGDSAEVARLQAMITSLIREDTRRNRGEPGASPRGYDREVRGTGIFANVNTTPSARTGGGGTSGATRAIRDNSAALKEQADAARAAILATDDFDRSVMGLEDSQKAWHERVQDLTAELKGPAAVALLDYTRSMDELAEAKRKHAITDEDAVAWEQALGEQYRNNTALADDYAGATEGLTDAQKGADAFRYAFEDAAASVFDRSEGIKGAIDDMAQSILQAFARIAAQRLTLSLFGGEGSAGSLLDLFSSGSSFSGGGYFAKGAAFSRGNVIPFASGGVVSDATSFAMAGGRTGVMGEAGPEAIMPLKRGMDGKLGIAGGGNTTINQTINVPKSYEYRTAQQVADASLSGMLRARHRNN